MRRLSQLEIENTALRKEVARERDTADSFRKTLVEVFQILEDSGVRLSTLRKTPNKENAK